MYIVNIYDKIRFLRVEMDLFIERCRLEMLKLFEKIEALTVKDKKTLKEIIKITIVKNSVKSAAQTKIL